MFNLFRLLNFIQRNIFIRSIPFAIVGGILYLIYFNFYNIEYIRKNIEDPAFRYFSILLQDKNISEYPSKILLFEVDNRYLKKHDLMDENNHTNENYGYFLPRKYVVNFIENLDNRSVKPKALVIDYNFEFSRNSSNTLSSDEYKLVQLLNQSHSYKIYIPHNSKYNFLSKYIINKNTIFCSTNFPKNSDGITRRFESYDTYQDTNYTNIALLLTEQNISNYKKYDIVENRIVFSNWKNIIKSSVTTLYKPSFYQDSIILFGANHSHNSDIHKRETLFGSTNISGVEIIGNSIMTLFYFDKKIEMLSLPKALILIILLGYISRIIILSVSKKIVFIHENNIFIWGGIFIFLSFVSSYFLFIYYQKWFNYLVPFSLYFIYQFLLKVEEVYNIYKIYKGYKK